MEAPRGEGRRGAVPPSTGFFRGAVAPRASDPRRPAPALAPAFAAQATRRAAASGTTGELAGAVSAAVGPFSASTTHASNALAGSGRE